MEVREDLKKKKKKPELCADDIRFSVVLISRFCGGAGDAWLVDGDIAPVLAGM